MNELFTELFELFTRLWNTSNRWLHTALVLMLSWFPLLVGAAIIPSHFVINILIFIPILTVIFLILSFPVLIYLMRAFTWSRNLLKTLATIVAVQISLGIALLLIPIHNDRGLVPIFVAAIIAFILFTVGVKKENKAVKKVKKLLVIFLSVLVVIFLAGGREKINQEIEEARAKTENAEVYTEPSDTQPPQYPESETMTFEPGQTQLTITAYPGQWTSWIETPPETQYWWLADNYEFDIQFYDGLLITNPYAVPSVQKGIFKFRAHTRPITITTEIKYNQ